MPTIDPSKLTPEILEKYTVENESFRLDKIKNAELDKYDGKPKDEISVIVGDDKVPDKFIPQVKLERWSNEVNFSVRLIDNETGTETVKTDKDKIVWEKGNIKIESYDFTEGEGGYKFVWYLKEKPLTNKVEFTIQSKGLDFFYQPELTPEEIAEGASRPENVVGSYAVYHSTKGGMNDKDGKEYKTGKAFHIFRPEIIDAEGTKTWGILHIENGIYSVEIPQDFLDKAVYPIKSNDTLTFGNTGETEVTAGAANYINGSYFTGATGTGVSLSVRIKQYLSQTPRVKCNVYTKTSLHNGSALANGSTVEWEVTTSYNDWKVFNFSSAPTFTAVEYYLVFWNGDEGFIRYYDAVADAGGAQNVAYGAWPGTITLADNNRNYSIYATYTPSGGETAVKDIIQSGLIAFPR